MNSVAENQVTFKELEEVFFQLGCEIAANLLKQVMEKLDEEISEKREKKIYRHKGIRKTTIKTLMGEVEVNRRIYQVHNEEGSIEHRYLLDEALGMQVVGNISMNLAERIIKEASETSYRNTANNISELSNQSISHQGVWNLVQNAGQVIKRVEQELVTAHRQGKLKGETEIKVLLEEADGIWISMQGASRPKRGNGKKELKIGCTYEGWKERYSGSKEYKTINKHTIAGMMTSDEFHAIKEAALAQKYNLDEIQYRILNGDGAKWIKQVHEIDDTIHYQLDPYHLSKTVVKAVVNKQAAGQILKWLRSGQTAKALDNINHLKYQRDGLKSEIKKLEALENYIHNQKDYLVPYQKREEIQLPEAPEGIYYRNLGTMESQVSQLAKRMKGAKSWSKSGADNMAKILALKNSPDFLMKINRLLSGKISPILTEEIEQHIHRASSKVKQTIKMRKGVLPFTGQSVTSGRKAIRQFFDLQNFTQLIYR